LLDIIIKELLKAHHFQTYTTLTRISIFLYQKKNKHALNNSKVKPGICVDIQWRFIYILPRENRYSLRGKREKGKTEGRGRLRKKNEEGK